MLKQTKEALDSKRDNVMRLGDSDRYDVNVSDVHFLKRLEQELIRKNHGINLKPLTEAIKILEDDQNGYC